MSLVQTYLFNDICGALMDGCMIMPEYMLPNPSKNVTIFLFRSGNTNLEDYFMNRVSQYTE